MAQSINCGLCDLPCGRKPMVRGYDAREIAFCCMGCANVYAILLESGVIASGQNIRETEVFRRSLELGLISNPNTEPVPPIDIDPQAPTREMLLQVNGMWCSACAWLIEHALRGLPGVVSADVFFASDLAKVKYWPQYLPPDTISARIAKLGYQAVGIWRGEHCRKIGVARSAAAPWCVPPFCGPTSWAFSTILYVGYFEQICRQRQPHSAVMCSGRWPRRWCSTAPGPFCARLPSDSSTSRSAWRRCWRWAFLPPTFSAPHKPCAARPTSTSIRPPLLSRWFLAGKLIERAAKDRAARSIGDALPDDAEKGAPAERRRRAVCLHRCAGAGPGLSSSRRVNAYPPMGLSSRAVRTPMNRLLSGEATPVPKRPGDTVVSGSLNADGLIQVRATRTGDDSALAQIIRLVERALSSRAPIERTVDQVARVFVPAVVLLALVDLRSSCRAARKHRRRPAARHDDSGHCLPLRAWPGYAIGHYRRCRFGIAGRTADQRRARARDHGQDRCGGAGQDRYRHPRRLSPDGICVGRSEG